MCWGEEKGDSWEQAVLALSEVEKAVVLVGQDAASVLFEPSQTATVQAGVRRLQGLTDCLRSVARVRGPQEISNWYSKELPEQSI